MGALRAGFNGTVGQSSAQVIDGSLKFDDDKKQFLKKTFSSGNSRTWTWSAWIKRNNFGSDHRLFTSDADANNQGGFKFIGDQIQFFFRTSGSFDINLYTEAYFRDTGWYHMMAVVDTTISSPSTDRVKLYVNGALQTIDSSYNTYPSENYETRINTNTEHLIGRYTTGDSQYMNGAMSQVYFIDGQALTPDSFGFTDPLTNTWRPKKYTGTYGTNGFYLPMDGNSPIGQDKSGKGNNWTPVNFGGSNSLEKATGALPILNTDGGGKTARPGVFGSEASKYYTLTGSSNSSTGYVFENEGTKPTLSMIRGTTHTFDYTSATSHPLYLSSLSDGKHNAKAYSVSFDGTGDYLSIPNSSDFIPGTNDFTIEGFFYLSAHSTGATTNLYGINNGGGLNPKITVYVDPNGTLHFDFTTAGGASLITSSSGTITTGVWYHIAFVRNSGVFNGYVNGSSVGSSSASINLTGLTQPFFIGYIGESYGTTLNGFVSNFNFINGTALYTTNFTPPTAPLTDVTNTKLLCCQDSDATTAVVSPGAITANGDAAATNTYNPFVYNVDNYFGVDTSTSNVTKMTVPHYAPDTLYYYCNVHSGMGNSISVTTDTKKADPYAWKNVLGLPLVGSSADVSNQINSGSTTKTITNSGTAEASSAQSNFYGGSFYFDGTNDYLSTPHTTDLEPGTGDFTVECWIYPTSIGGNGVIVLSKGGTAFNDQDGWTLLLLTNNTVRFFIQGAPSHFTSNNTIALNTWNHIAVSRSGSTLRLFLNGTLDNSTTNSQNIANASYPFYVGRSQGNGGEYWNRLAGYAQDVRFYKGVAKYTSNFIPTSTSPDILPGTPSGVSGSSKLTKITDGAVSFDGSGDYLRIAATSDFDQSPGTDFTAEAYIYMTAASGPSHIMGFQVDGNNRCSFYFTDGATTLNWYTNLSGSGSNKISTSSNYVSLNAWHHVAVTRSGSTSYLFVDGILQGTSTTTDYPSGNQLLDIGTYNASGYNPDSFPGFISNVRYIKGTALYTSNFTPPTEPLTDVTNTKLLCCQSNTSAAIAAVSPNISGLNDGTVWSDANIGDPIRSTQNIDAIFDGDSSTGSETDNGAGKKLLFDFENTFGSIPVSSSIKVWIGGSDGRTVKVNGTTIATNASSASNPFTVTNQSQLNSVEVLSETSTRSGFLNQISVDDVALTNPVIRNGNASATNFNPFNTDINTVRGQETGYATLNPLSKSSGTTFTLSDGNLTLNAEDVGMEATLRASTGKFYWETTLLDYHSNGAFYCGLGAGRVPERGGNGGANLYYPAYTGYTGTSGVRIGSNDATMGVYSLGTQILVKNSGWAIGDLIGITVDCDRKKLQVYHNGIKLGGECDLPSGESEFSFYTFVQGGSGDPSEVVVNFGQKPFKFSPPDGFQPLNAANVRPETVIARPDQYVDITTWSGAQSGSGGLTRQISTVFQPDFVWIKQRNQAYSTGHQLYDSVRGAGAEKELNSSGTAAEGAGNIETYGWLNSFDKTGFTVKGGSTDYDYVDKTGVNYVAWTWKAGGGSGAGGEYWIDDVQYANAAAAGLDGGSGITLTGASVGTKQGFSILRYTGGASGSTLSHGLTQAPDFWIIKNLSGNTQGTAGPHWYTKHKSLPGGKTGNDSLFLNLTNAQGSNGPHGICKTSGDSLFEFVDGSSNDVNWHTHDSAATYICYAWHDVPGLQKFGTYEGNNSADGPFIELGFRPAILLIKNIDDGTINWRLGDSERSPFNPIDDYVSPNNANQEIVSSVNAIDLLSNGFKCRGSSGGTNSSHTFIYAAWAEAPTFNLYGAQSNAR